MIRFGMLDFGFGILKNDRNPKSQIQNPLVL